jgi:hypothetical protein
MLAILTIVSLEVSMRKSYLYLFGLVALLLVGNVGQAQDSLGMRCLSGLEYWTHVNQIQMVGNLAYVMAGPSGLHIMSLADPTNPVEIGRFTWYQSGPYDGGVYVIGNRAYLGIGNGGFVLDVRDPSHPVVLAQWTDLGSGPISFVHDNYAIAHDEEGVPFILDISDPNNAHYIANFPGGGIVSDAMGMAGEYLCTSGPGLRVWDMSNPAQPQLVASVDTTFGAWYGVVSGNYGYYASVDYGLRIIDLSNPLQPVEVGSCDSSEQTWDVAVTGSHAVTLKISTSWDNYWLNIWNITDPAHPVFEGTIPTTGFGTFRVSAAGNLVYTPMSESDNLIMEVDISNPAAPVVVGSFGTCGWLYRTVLSDTIAFITDARTQMRTVNINNPNHLFGLSSMDLSNNEGRDIATRGNYAYLTMTDAGSNISLEVFEVSNPAEPESVYNVSCNEASEIVTEGDYVYAASLTGISTFSLANPAIPQCVNFLNLPFGSAGLGLAVADGYLYRGAGTSFSVCSLSNPAAPQLVGSCNLGGGCCIFDLAVAGHYAYVANGYGGMRIVDVSDPANPCEINWIGGFWVGAVAASGNIAIMDDDTRISIWDVTNPLNPILVGYYSTYEYIRDLEIQGQYLFTTGWFDFRVYQCDALTNVIPTDKPLPAQFNLLPPYPNPFNPSTVIRFSLPYTQQAKLTIYDITGRQVKVLTNEILSAGEHRVTFDGSDLSSGVYFVRLQSGQHTQTEKMVLLK